MPILSELRSPKLRQSAIWITRTFFSRPRIVFVLAVILCVLLFCAVLVGLKYGIPIPFVSGLVLGWLIASFLSANELARVVWADRNFESICRYLHELYVLKAGIVDGGANRLRVTLFFPRGREMKARARFPVGTEGLPRQSWAKGDGVLGLAFATGQVVRVVDLPDPATMLEEYRRAINNVSPLGEALHDQVRVNARSFLCIPIVYFNRKNEIAAIASFDSTNPDDFVLESAVDVLIEAVRAYSAWFLK